MQLVRAKLTRSEHPETVTNVVWPSVRMEACRQHLAVDEIEVVGWECEAGEVSAGCCHYSHIAQVYFMFRLSICK